MLVLGRKLHETIVIGTDIRVTAVSIHGSRVKLAIEAPPDVLVLREEHVPRRRDDPSASSNPTRP